MNYRRNSEAAQRFAERRQREDEAPRLRAEVPQLDSLRLEIEEHRGGGTIADSAHIRRVVVDYAPALFLVPCGDSSCKDGGHDITRAVMQALHAGAQRFEGEDSCRGQIGSASCSRVMRFVAVATYR